MFTCCKLLPPHHPAAHAYAAQAQFQAAKEKQVIKETGSSFLGEDDQSTPIAWRSWDLHQVEDRPTNATWNETTWVGFLTDLWMVFALSTHR